MRVDHFGAVRNAITSVSNSTDVMVHVGDIRIAVTRRNSPYVSHREIVFETVSPAIPGVVVSNRRCGVFVPEAQGTDEYPTLPAVGREWIEDDIFEQSPVGGAIPQGLVQPLLSLVSELGITAPWIDELWRDRPLITVYTERPVLGSFWREKPIYALKSLFADGLYDEKPVLAQGKLRIHQAYREIPANLTLSCESNPLSILNHTMTSSTDSQPADDVPAPPPHAQLGSAWLWFMRTYGGSVRLTSPDHEEVGGNLPTGDYVIVHRIPRLGGTMD